MTLKITKIKPMFTSLVTTANKYESDVKEGGIVVITAGTLKEYQTVVSVGPHVNGIQVGDMVMINPRRFAVVNQKGKPKSLKDDMGVDSQKISFAFDFVTIENTPHLLLQDRDIDYVFEGEEVDDTPNIIVPEKKIII